MPEYLSPGVYIEEIDAGPKPIAPVATSTAGAVGVTQRGPVTPTLVTSYGDYVRTFGGPLPIPDDATRAAWDDRGHYWHAAESIKAFFDEGGARVYMQRVVPSGALESQAAFSGGLRAGLRQDVEPADTALQLTHVFGIAANTVLSLVSEDGSAIGPVTVTSVDYAARTVTLGAPAGVSARRERDFVAVLPLGPTLDVLTASAASAGAWGDDISVKIEPAIGARRTLGAAPTSGNRVTTQTTAPALAAATDIVVTPVLGSLVATTPAGFRIQINGGAPVTVTAVAAAAPDVKLTLATPLAAVLPAGAGVSVLRPAGRAVGTRTTAAAAAAATDITVAPVAGFLDATTSAGFSVRVAGGAPVAVTAVAAAVPDVKLTLATPLAAAVPAASDVALLLPAGATITVVGADRLYREAVVQLEGAAGAEVLTVDGVVGSQVTLSATPANAYLEGDSLTLVEAEVNVRYRPAGGNEETERFLGMRLTNTPDPTSLVAGVNLRSHLVRLAAGVDYDGTDLQAFPAATTGAWAALDNGDDALGTLVPADFIGVNLGPGNRTGIQALEEIDQVAICIAPGMWDVDIRNELIIHCETLAERFAILDPPPGLDVQGIERFRSPIDTKYAALYYPWVEIRDPRPGGSSEQAPPSGFMAGIYARTDVARGVHKAPANEVIRSIRGLAQAITKREQDILNPQNINVLRAFPGRGNRVWGARVLTSDSAWKYVPVRRLFLMIEESIDEGTQWVVFEPNDEPLWARVRQSVTRFLITQWRIGALQGVTADEAFFVACDRSTMTQDDIDNGRLICQVGIAPVKPAEFVIFRIQQKTLEISTN